MLHLPTTSVPQGSNSWVLASWAPCSAPSEEKGQSWTEPTGFFGAAAPLPLRWLWSHTSPCHRVCSVNRFKCQKMLCCSSWPLQLCYWNASRALFLLFSPKPRILTGAGKVGGHSVWGVLFRGANLTLQIYFCLHKHKSCVLGKGLRGCLGSDTSITPSGIAQTMAAFNYWFHLIQIKASTGY